MTLNESQGHLQWYQNVSLKVIFIMSSLKEFGMQMTGIMQALELFQCISKSIVFSLIEIFHAVKWFDMILHDVKFHHDCLKTVTK